MFDAAGVWLEQPDTVGHGGQRQRRLQVGSRKIFQGSKNIYYATTLQVRAEQRETRPGPGEHHQR